MSKAKDTKKQNDKKKPQKTLKDLLNQVSFAMAVHDIRYYLNGILFVAEGKQLSLVATEGKVELSAG